MNIDHKFSHGLFRATRRSWFWGPLAIFSATSLLFIMVFAAVFCTSVDCDVELGQRLLPTLAAYVIPLFITWAVVFMCQWLFKRERPFEEGHDALIKMVWQAPSFPSAHAALAFAAAAVAFWNSAGYWFFIVAAVVAVSRVAVGVHYVSDVLVGSLIGFVVGSASWYALIWLLLSL